MTILEVDLRMVVYKVSLLTLAGYDANHGLYGPKRRVLLID